MVEREAPILAGMEEERAALKILEMFDLANV
jgi:hypothetical protein